MHWVKQILKKLKLLLCLWSTIVTFLQVGGVDPSNSSQQPILSTKTKPNITKKLTGDPKIFSIRRAKVETLSNAKEAIKEEGILRSREANYGDKKPTLVKITTYTAESEEPERHNVDGLKKPIRFSKLISSKSTIADKKPVRVTISLFEENNKNRAPSASLRLQEFVPHHVDLNVENQVDVTHSTMQFEPMRMVEIQEKVLHGPEVLPPTPTVQYFPTNPILNYQYFTQAQPQFQSYYQQQHHASLVLNPQNIDVRPSVAKSDESVDVVTPSSLKPPSPLSLPQYNFAYRVHDSISGTNHGHTEFRNGNVVHGRYALMDPDGLLRTVSYTSDPVYGFNAVVDRQFPSHTADTNTQLNNGGISYGYHHHGHGNPGFFAYAL
ncbi:Cuticle protein 21 [Folsomia candida]|uniref:Cuticle protein 21 n=1 Tax=Folsomia candida TaxID=158441 RepID=A0A226F043_FOLCA|nr:Cuticle protein 21 [Folsomia candida]